MSFPTHAPSIPSSPPLFHIPLLPSSLPHPSPPLLSLPISSLFLPSPFFSPSLFFSSSTSLPLFLHPPLSSLHPPSFHPPHTRCKNSVKHYRVLWDGQQFIFGLCKFANVAEFQDHFRNQPMISGESGALVLLNNPYPRCVSEPDTYIDATYFEESTAPSVAISPSQFAVRRDVCVLVG